MQSLARVLVERGHIVSGVDASPVLPTWLADSGVETTCGTAPTPLPRDAKMIVFSDAVPPDSPERRCARKLGIPALSYPAALGMLMQQRTGLAVAGTHGKSTTTAMTAAILEAATLDPTVVAGANDLELMPVARHGLGEHMLVEACEYRANLLHLAPRFATILNVDADHFDCFRTADDLDRAFREFAERLPADGQLIINHRCERTRRLIDRVRCEVTTFGLETNGPGADAHWQARNVTLSSGRPWFDLYRQGQNIGRVRLRVAGLHQVENALAAAALASTAGASDADILAGLSSFAGLHRRLETIASLEGVTVVDDYAHHPTELQAALATMRAMFPRRRLWCVFQPHQASRTAALLDEFSTCLAEADKLAIAEIYRAREGQWRPGEVRAADLARGAAGRGADVLQVHAMNDILEHIHAALRPGDVVLTAGAGDVGTLAHALVHRLRALRAAG
jgi:UDP-N-acetylmuramate--alanine ligase